MEADRDPRALIESVRKRDLAPHDCCGDCDSPGCVCLDGDCSCHREVKLADALDAALARVADMQEAADMTRTRIALAGQIGDLQDRIKAMERERDTARAQDAQAKLVRILDRQAKIVGVPRVEVVAFDNTKTED